MTISDEARYRLHQRLDETLGPQEAATLMAHLPPVGWADVATRQDVDNLGVSLRSEIATVRSEMTSGFAAVQSEFVSVRSEFASVRSEMGTLEARVVGRLDRELRFMTWRMVMALVAVMSIVVAAVRL